MTERLLAIAKGEYDPARGFGPKPGAKLARTRGRSTRTDQQLADLAVELYPIEGFGQRNDLLVDLTLWLKRMGVATAQRAGDIHDLWHAAQADRCRTDGATSRAEAESMFDRLDNRPGSDFHPASGLSEAEHLERLREQFARLDLAELVKMLAELGENPRTGENNAKKGSQVRRPRPRTARLSIHDPKYVAAALLMATCRPKADSKVRMTDRQVFEVAGLNWHPTTNQRLKLKWFDRPDRPTEGERRFPAILRRTLQGERMPRGNESFPSEYVLTDWGKELVAVIDSMMGSTATRNAALLSMRESPSADAI